MTDRFLGSLKDIERQMQKELFSYSTNTLQRLDDIALAMIDEPMSDNDYLKFMELYARKYDKMPNKKARTYCIMRMQQVVDAKTNEKRQKEFPGLTFSKRMDEYTEQYLKSFKNYEEYYKNTFKLNLLRLDLGLTIAIMIFLVLVLQISFFIGWPISILFFIAVFLFGTLIGFPKIMQDQFDHLIQEVEPNCLAVDKSVRKNL